VITFLKEKVDMAQLEEKVFETDVENMEDMGDQVKIITSIEKLSEVKDFFQKNGFVFDEAKVEYRASNYTDVTEFDKALKITKMCEALEEDEDVEDFTMNCNIGDALQKEVHEFIEKNTFRT
jgi:transcriptional/translational regulatory protein YebC/TACO1